MTDLQNQDIPLHIFLDFDGVLHDYDAGPTLGDLETSPPRLNPRTFARLPILETAVRDIEATGRNVQIHLATSWRQAMPLETLLSFLGAYIGARTVACTPQLGNGSHRDLEVIQHLISMDALDDPKKSRWICIDDNPDLYEAFNHFTEFRRRVFITDDKTGLTVDDIADLVELAATL